MAAKTMTDKILEAIQAGNKFSRITHKTWPTMVSGGIYHGFQFGPVPGPGTYPGVALNVVQVNGGSAPSMTTGILTFATPAGAKKKFFTYWNHMGFTANGFGTLKIIDLLVYYPGFSGTFAGAQATNSPAASNALPRYTDGVDVFAFADPTVALGANPQAATVSYTNDAGVGGRTGSFTTIASAVQGRVAHTPHRVVLQSGDKGIKSIQNVNLAASTLAGTFAMCLAYELAELFIDATGKVVEAKLASDPPVFWNLGNTCALSYMAFSTAAPVTPTFTGRVETVDID